MIFYHVRQDEAGSVNVFPNTKASIKVVYAAVHNRLSSLQPPSCIEVVLIISTFHVLLL